MLNLTEEIYRGGSIGVSYCGLIRNQSILSNCLKIGSVDWYFDRNETQELYKEFYL